MATKSGLIAVIFATVAWCALAQQPARTLPSPAEAVSPQQAGAADLQRMRTLVQQMQMNLVSLPPGPTPLRHQFELEIEMWQTLISHLERQSPPMRRTPPER